MPKSIKAVISLATACGVAAICVSASAGAAVPRGTLTGAEYRQLSTGMAALNRSVGTRSVNWVRARAACRELGAATELLRTQRASCLRSLAVLDSLAHFPREQRQCSARITTTTGTTTVPTSTTGTTTTGTTTSTTGTTTSPADTAIVQLLVCMGPRYHALAHYARNSDAGAIAERRAALARGFRGACLAALAPSDTDLRKARGFASSTARLAADVDLLIKVTEGKAPSSDFNQATVDNDVRQFETSASAVLDEHGQPKLSVCPHE
jgi:hypothetical protein